MTPVQLALAILVAGIPSCVITWLLYRETVKLNEGFAQFNKLFGADSAFAPVDTPEGEKLREFKATPPTALYETDRARALSEGYDVGQE